MKRLHLLLLGLSLLVSFTIFSRYIKHGGMKNLDFAITVKIQERIDNSSRLRLARITGEIMEGSSFLASPLVSSIAVMSITVLMVITRRKWRVTALVIPLAFGLMTLAEIYGKSVVHHPAPPFFLLKNPTTVFPKYYVWEDYSYPSGHVARAVFLAISSFSLLTLRLRSVQASHYLRMKKGARLVIGVTLVGYVMLVGISRIYLGHHWLSDVVGGILLGTSISVLAIARKRGINGNRNLFYSKC